jgi:adhesin transport system outer membrane protein
MKTLVCLAVASTLQVLPGTSVAQDSSALLDAVRKAVVTSPEVQASFYEYQAATAAQDVAKGGYLPSLDLSAAVGRHWSKHHKQSDGNDKDKWNYKGAALDLTQMIYDGFATRSEVRQMGYERLVSYYKLLGASEKAGAEAVRAYADVEKSRELVEHAKANYATHKQIYDQINNRTTAGVGRKVDLDQAAGRLALAESNLLQEVTNLHDVSTRYQRVVGELPPDTLQPVNDTFAGVQLPPNVVAALREAYVSNPDFNAAIETVRAAEAGRDYARSGYHPKLNFHAQAGINPSIGGTGGGGAYESTWEGDNRWANTREALVELQLKWNLYRGGADKARVRFAGEKVSAAQNTREQACRDLRQNLSIAFQKTRSLNEKLAYLDKHQSSTALAREAYRRQFDIGQRTLLDVLDSENEYFTSRRDYTTARYDLVYEKANTLAQTGQLLQVLGVQRDDLPTAQDAGQDRSTVDPADMCPADAPATVDVNKGALTTGASYR